MNSVFRHVVSQKCAVLGSRNNTEERSSHLLTFQQSVLLSSSGGRRHETYEADRDTHVANS